MNNIKKENKTLKNKKIVYTNNNSFYNSKNSVKNIINRDKIIEAVEKIYKLFFIGYVEDVKKVDKYIKKLERGIYKNLYQELKKTNSFSNKFNSLEEFLDDFMKSLPEIKEILELDILSILENDPAVESKEEIVLAYPGIFAIFVYRIAHKLYLGDVKTIPRIMSEYAHSKTGIDIHPGATIGKYFFIDHGTGIVIGQTAVIGDWVRIYQGVTIGAKSLRKGSKLSGTKRHPTILNNVIIYANAAILGGDTVIGNNVIIGSNVFILSSIPDNIKVLNKNYEIVLLEDNANSNAISFSNEDSKDLDYTKKKKSE